MEPGDRIAVCISGGKDSMVLAKLMQELQRPTESPFELTFLAVSYTHLDVYKRQIYFDESVLEDGQVICPNCGEKLEFDLSDMEDEETPEDQE